MQIIRHPNRVEDRRRPATIANAEGQPTRSIPRPNYRTNRGLPSRYAGVDVRDEVQASRQAR